MVAPATGPSTTAPLTAIVVGIVVGGGEDGEGDELSEEQAAKTHAAAAKVSQDNLRFIGPSPCR
jgi:hypothetical protein